MISIENITGIQQIRNLLRIYLSRHEDCIRFITVGLVFRGATAPVLEVSPFIREKKENLTRLAIKDVSLSLSIGVITSELERKQKWSERSDSATKVTGQLKKYIDGNRVDLFVHHDNHYLDNSS